MQAIKLLAISSLLGIGACSSIDRPDANLCFTNIKAALKENLPAHKSCYNLKNDYDDTGARLATAKPVVTNLTDLSDLDEQFTMDAESLAKVKAYIQKIRAAYATAEE